MRNCHVDKQFVVCLFRSGAICTAGRMPVGFFVWGSKMKISNSDRLNIFFA